MPDVWKDDVLLTHGEAPGEVQSVGPRSWFKPMTVALRPQMDWNDAVQLFFGLPK